MQKRSCRKDNLLNKHLSAKLFSDKNTILYNFLLYNIVISINKNIYIIIYYFFVKYVFVLSPSKVLLFRDRTCPKHTYSPPLAGNLSQPVFLFSEQPLFRGRRTPSKGDPPQPPQKAAAVLRYPPWHAMQGHSFLFTAGNSYGFYSLRHKAPHRAW